MQSIRNRMWNPCDISNVIRHHPVVISEVALMLEHWIETEDWCKWFREINGWSDPDIDNELKRDPESVKKYFDIGQVYDILEYRLTLENRMSLIRGKEELKNDLNEWFG